MSSKGEKDRQKAIQDKCQQLLNEMLRDEDNKYCVDCDAKGRCLTVMIIYFETAAASLVENPTFVLCDVFMCLFFL